MIMAATAIMAMGCSADINPEDIRVADYKDGKACAVSLTFDDAMKEHYTIVAPELEKRGFRGTFWLCGAWMPEEAQMDTTHMTWAEAKEMHGRGHEMSNHTWAHPYLTQMTKEEVLEQMKRNDDMIEERVGARPVTFCFPYNAFNDELVAMAMEGRVGARLKEFWLGGQHSPKEYLEKQVTDAIASGSWIAGMTHGINYGYDCYENPAEFTDFLDYVKSLENDIWVGTFRDVAVYRKAAAETVLDIAEGKGVTITPTLNLDRNLYEGLLTMEVSSDRKISAEQDGQKLEVTARDGKSYFSFNPFGGAITIR